MKPIDWIKPDDNYLRNGLKLAILNGVLALFCAVSLFLIFYILIVVNNWLIVSRGVKAAIPFPLLILFFLYSILFIFSWYSFAKRLPAMPLKEILKISFLGSSPLIILSALTFVYVSWNIISGNFRASFFDANVFVYSSIALIIFVVALSSFVLTSVIAKNQH